MVLSNVVKSVTEADVQKVMREYFADLAAGQKVRNFMAAQFSLIEAKGEAVVKVEMSAQEYEILRRYMASAIDPVTRKEAIARGYRGGLWGADIWHNQDVQGLRLTGDKGTVLTKRNSL